MTAIDVLKAAPHSLPAKKVAEMSGQPVEETYSQLVQAERAGDAEVVIQFHGGRVVSREWRYRRSA